MGFTLACLWLAIVNAHTDLLPIFHLSLNGIPVERGARANALILFLFTIPFCDCATSG